MIYICTRGKMEDLLSKLTRTKERQKRSKKKTKPLEKAFKDKVRKRLSRVRGLYFFTKEAVSIRGIPDIIGCTRNGIFFAWELKRSRDDVYYKTKKGIKSSRAKMQWHNIKKIRKAGGIADFVYPENFEERLAELLDS